MGEWRDYKLETIASFKYGKMPKYERFVESGYPVFSGYRVVGQYPEWNCEAGQVIIVARGVGGTGDVKIVPERSFVTNLSLIAEFDNEVVDNRFFYYKFLADNLMYLDSGSAQSQITIQDLSQISISFPQLTEQRAIAEVLSSLDDKIDLLHRQNKTLESLAKTLFRQWFIEEPEDVWEERGLDGIAEFLNGLACQKFPRKLGEVGLPVIKIRELRGGVTEASDIVTADVPEKYLVQDGDILFSWSGSLDVVIWSSGKGVLNQHLFKVTSAEFPQWFYYFWIKQHLQDFRGVADDKATTMGHIQRHHLTDARVSVPTSDEFELFDNTIDPLFQKIKANNQQIQAVTRLRDALLPKLMNGDALVASE